MCKFVQSTPLKVIIFKGFFNGGGRVRLGQCDSKHTRHLEHVVSLNRGGVSMRVNVRLAVIGLYCFSVSLTGCDIAPEFPDWGDLVGGDDEEGVPVVVNWDPSTCGPTKFDCSSQPIPAHSTVACVPDIGCKWE